MKAEFAQERFKEKSGNSHWRFHANVAVVLEHLFRDMAGDVHDGLIASAALGQLGDEGVPVVVPPSLYAGLRRLLSWPVQPPGISSQS